MTTKPKIEQITLDSESESITVVGLCAMVSVRRNGQSLSIRTGGLKGDIHTFAVREDGSLLQVSGPPISVWMMPGTPPRTA